MNKVTLICAATFFVFGAACGADMPFKIVRVADDSTVVYVEGHRGIALIGHALSESDAKAIVSLVEDDEGGKRKEEQNREYVRKIHPPDEEGVVKVMTTYAQSASPRGRFLYLKQIDKKNWSVIRVDESEWRG